MIYRLLLISDEVDNFMREIKIGSDATFLDLNKAILDSCGYTDDQMTSFVMCEDGWQKGQEITREVMDTDSDQDSYVMATTNLDEFIEDEHQHILYIFDPLADRCFFIEVAEIITGKKLSTPKVTRTLGEAPKQLTDFDELFARNPISVDSDLDIDEDLYGDGISEEDNDLEGLDISDGNPFD